MYQVDDKDRVLEIKDIPQSSVGAPIPAVISGEHSAAIVFYTQSIDPEWDGSTVRVVDADSHEPSVMVRFDSCYVHTFGPPNDEVFSSHPLYERGLHPYANFEVKNSSWIRSFEKMNSVHPYHNKDNFLEGKRHFILAFHDSTFECIAKSYAIEKTEGSIHEALSRLGQEIDQ